MTKSPFIVALDVDTQAEAEKLIDQLEGSVDFFKIGMQLQLEIGAPFIRRLKARGKRIFLDYKYNDISRTVGAAVRQACRHGVDFLDVHAEPQIMRAAVAERGESNTKIFAVTVLTSLQKQDLLEMGITEFSVEELVVKRAIQARDCGCDGVVASAKEVPFIKKTLGEDFLCITPGVRLEAVEGDDQKRVMTPKEALKAGADYLVVGRPVTMAQDPVSKIKRYLEEIAS